MFLKSSITNVPIDKTNLTNFQRIFLNEKDLTRTEHGIDHRNTQTSSSVFEVVHSLAIGDTINNVGSSQEKVDCFDGNISCGRQSCSSKAVIYNPLLLSIPSYDEAMANKACSGYYQNLSNLTSLKDGGFNSSMHIDKMFDDAQEHVNILF